MNLRRFLPAALLPVLMLRGAPATPDDAARQLAQRVVPALAGHFSFETIPADGGRDVFEIEGVGGKVVLRGNNGVALASALNRYVEEFGHGDISWNCGDQLALPEPLPPVPQKVRVVSPHRFRYAYNYCTHGYTMAWWDWPRWERELDFLALKGVNLALVIEGQEQVWIDAYGAFGYTAAEVRRWLCLPSHQPWQYMANMEDYGGPVPPAVIERRVALGRKIVARMRELGMEPVLQGYYGMVPSDFKTRFPQAKVHPQGDWNEVQRPDMLDPLDPLFAKMATAFYAAQERLLGPVGYLDADPFHEGGSTEGIDLAACGRAIFGAMDRARPGVTWVLQGWLDNPRQPMIDGLDKSRLLVLDLFCDTKENWRVRDQFGHTPWLWCTIQSWGGNVGLGGDLDGLRAKPALALAEAGPGKGQMRGIGALLEGSETQPLLWGMFFGNAWRSDAPDLGDWLRDYAHRRYGAASPAVVQALQIEVETVYAHQGYVESVVCARPSFEPYPKARLWGSTEPGYDTTRFAEAWRSLLAAAPACGGSDGYRYDLADVGRQVLADLAGRYHRAILQAYAAKDAPAVGRLSSRMLGLFDDLDALLATRKEFLLGVWLADARRYGTTKDEQDLCEVGARELLTTWTSHDNVTDYANRQWSGLVGTFYRARWQTWLDALQASLATGKALDFQSVRAIIRDGDLAWTRQHDGYPAEPRGQTIEVARRLFEKYATDATDKTLGGGGQGARAGS
ncbi:MAG TPA: alpha-N-acetylglucosaminidase [Opitutaceae bacterium]|nr:alpha-N-acetylglucosaminidase [Opitutaceae bacterium]